jgi:bis(5'-nucleosyl)-tetraphosphatase (symmetrical)
VGGTWVIGDIHGCFDSLKRLWRRLDFDWENDRLWLVGDLVNRGPKSLEVLRWARRRSRRLGERMVVVLGNHDLHLLAVDRGVSSLRPGDTIKPVLKADDRKPLLRWLRAQRFLHRQGDFLLVHAGLHPHWSVEKAVRKAARLERVLGTRREAEILARRVEDTDARRSTMKLRQSTYAFTLLRSCTPSGSPCSFSGPPEKAPKGCQPWYRLWEPLDHGVTVVCGHWAAQGLKVRPGMIALDSGCVWGGALTAIRLEDLRIVKQRALEPPQRAG